MILRVPGDAVLLRAAPMERDGFPAETNSMPVSFTNDSDREHLTVERSQSVQESSVRYLELYELTSAGTIDCFY